GGPPPGAPESTALARKERVEEVAEISEARGSAGGPATGLRLVLARKLLLALDPLPVGAHLVVLRPLLGIAEHLVGFIDQLEPIGSLRVLVDVGVVLPSQASIGGLDLLLGGRPGDTEGLVVVLVLRCSHICVSRGHAHSEHGSNSARGGPLATNRCGRRCTRDSAARTCRPAADSAQSEDGHSWREGSVPQSPR